MQAASIMMSSASTHPHQVCHDDHEVWFYHHDHPKRRSPSCKVKPRIAGTSLIAQIHKWNWPIRNDVLLDPIWRSVKLTPKQDLFNSVNIMNLKKCIKRIAFAKPDKFLNVRLQTLCAILVQFAIWTHLNSPTPKLCISHNTSSVARSGRPKLCRIKTCVTQCT